MKRCFCSSYKTRRSLSYQGFGELKMVPGTGDTTELTIGIRKGGRKNMPVMETIIKNGMKIHPSRLCHWRLAFRATTSLPFSFCFFFRCFNHFGKIKCIRPVSETISIASPNKSTTSLPIGPQISPLCSNHRVLNRLTLPS